MKLCTSAAPRFSPALWRSAIGVVSLSLAVLLGCLPLFSQGNAGRILGGVTDQTGGAVVGATVTIVDTQRNVTHSVTTDTAGEYNVPNLLPSMYTVTAAFQGFKTAQRNGITLEVNQDLRIDLTLQPGDQSEKITVTGELPLVETTNAELGGTIQNVIINDLPLNGRNFENLLSLRPGVTIFPGGGGWTQSTNGQRAHDNVYLVDGVNADDPWMAQSVMNAGMAAGDAGTILPIDAIDEFKTEQNPRAEFGWKPGSIVNVGIKGGTNNMHGTAYAFGRSDAFDSRDYFNPAPAPITPLQFEQFGASLGGPIKKDKLFYFLNYEDQRYSVGNPVTHDGVPMTGVGALDPMDGLQGACLSALASGTFAPVSAQLAGLSATCKPLSNYPGLFPANNNPTPVLNTSINTTNRIDSGMAKIDYHLNDKNSINGMYFISPGSGLLADNNLLQLNPSQLTIQYARAQVFAGNWAWTPNSTWVNEARVGYSHYYQTFLSNDHAQDPANYSFNGATYNLATGQTNSAYFGLPQIRFTSYSAFSLGASWPKTVGPDSVLQLLDHVSYLRGKHAFKFGFEYLGDRSTNNVTANAKGPIRFADLPTFFEGVPNRANFLTGNLLRHMSSSNVAAFAQDDWRVTPRLTVNLGLRYEYDGVMNERDGLFGNFDPTTATGLVQLGKGVNSIYNPDKNNFAPRLGVAWDVRGNGKTVVRAGASMAYEQFSYDMFNAIGNLLGLRMVPTGANLYANGALIPSPGNINVAAISFSGPALKGTAKQGQVAFDWIHNSPAVPLYNAAPSCGDGSVTLANGLVPTPCSILAVNPNIYNPYVTTWTLDVQRALTSNLSLDIAYVGNHGTGLIGITDVNEPPLGAGYQGAGTLGGTPLSEIAWCNTHNVATAATAGTVPTIGAGPTATAITCTNADASGDLEQAARPYNAKFPYLSYIDMLQNLDRSNYSGLQTTLTQRTSRGLSFTVGYTFAHALDNSSDNWACCIPIYGTVKPLYGNSVFDITHRGTISVTYNIPGKKGFGQMLEGWTINSIVTLQSGLPWGVSDTGNDFSGTAEVAQTNADGQGEQWDFFGNPKDFQISHGFTSNPINGDILAGGTGGIPFYAGSGDATTGAETANAACNAQAEKMGPSAQAALALSGCFAMGGSLLLPPSIGTFGTMGRNIFRDAGFRQWDFSLFKNFVFKEHVTAQFRVEGFNILNAVNFSNPGGPGGGSGTTDPSAGPGFGGAIVTADAGGSNPILGSGGPRVFQLGLKLIF
jgi:hypothetical protein